MSQNGCVISILVHKRPRFVDTMNEHSRTGEFGSQYSVSLNLPPSPCVVLRRINTKSTTLFIRQHVRYASLSQHVSNKIFIVDHFPF